MQPPNPQRYLDGCGAALLVPTLTEQAVGFHIVARHWHGLHHMKAVAATQTDRAVRRVLHPEVQGQLAGISPLVGAPREGLS